ncbi:MAG: hypothetical protein K9J30_08925 [Bacteroidales bacterium]|nr:hypothetical protein [Bacteroidales bacterium]
MIQHSEDKKLNLFKSLFKGREDVFARRWEKGNKRGYMPAYDYDPYMYRLHAMKGGTFKNYQDKRYLPLTDQQVQKHLNGEQFIGIYPLLPDNTSWFIAADFDKVNWVENCRTLINVCTEKEIPAYMERSRSGEGGHVWVFFDKPYPASRSYIYLNVNKNKQLLRQKLKSIDQDLNVIRNQGRQAFLEEQRENFSRLIHDYTDERKGFIVWKDKLEERLL